VSAWVISDSGLQLQQQLSCYRCDGFEFVFESTRTAVATPATLTALAAPAASALLVARVFPLGRPDDIQKSALYTSTHVRPGDAQKQSISPFQAFADAKQQQDLRTLHVKGGRVLL
jgi:hypothetical protein